MGEDIISIRPKRRSKVLPEVKLLEKKSEPIKQVIEIKSVPKKSKKSSKKSTSIEKKSTSDTNKGKKKQSDTIKKMAIEIKELKTQKETLITMVTDLSKKFADQLQLFEMKFDGKIQEAIESKESKHVEPIVITTQEYLDFMRSKFNIPNISKTKLRNVNCLPNEISIDDKQAIAGAMRTKVYWDKIFNWYQECVDEKIKQKV